MALRAFTPLQSLKQFWHSEYIINLRVNYIRNTFMFQCESFKFGHEHKLTIENQFE